MVQNGRFFLGKNNLHRPKLVVGFSAETSNLTQNSILKMKKKNCDIIVANDVSKNDSGFNSDFNRVLIIDNIGNIQSLKRNKKSFIANKIAEIVVKKLLVNESDLN